MSAKFMSGTRLFAYECMMQQIPDMGRCSKEEKRLKAQYAGMLKEYMREYGYNDCEFVKELYKDYTIVEHTRANSLAHRYDSGSRFKELLIANYDINERRKNEPIQLSLFGDGDYEFNYLQDYRYKRPNHTTVFIPRTIEENRT